MEQGPVGGIVGSTAFDGEKVYGPVTVPGPYPFVHSEVEVAEILELFTREIAPHYYNRAIFDVQTHLKERFESIESDLWALEKS